MWIGVKPRVFNAQQRRKCSFDLYHQVIIQDRDFDLNTYIMYLILIFELQELSSSLQSLMFELEGNPAPTKMIDSIMEKIARIIEITIDYHWGGLSHYIYTRYYVKEIKIKLLIQWLSVLYDPVIRMLNHTNSGFQFVIFRKLETWLLFGCWGLTQGNS